MDFKIIIRACLERIEYIEYLSKHLQYPNVIFCFDKKQNAMDTFLRAMDLASKLPCVHMEEDIILTTDFYSKLSTAIKAHQNEVIQFFSMRKADIEVGSRYDRGSTFMMNQCFYLPAGYSEMIADYYKTWEQKEKHPTGYDILIADFLKDRKEKYRIHVPSLVQHRESTSLINKKRSTKRQSLTFRDPMI